MRRARSSVEILGDRVRKTYSPELLPLEHAKARALWECGRQHGFVAPEPLSVDEAGAAIVYERIPGYASLTGPYVRAMHQADADGSFAAVLREAARVLACIHAELELPSARAWAPPPRMREGLRRAGDVAGRSAGRGPRAVLHGDFGFSNVAVLARGRAARPRLAVIDPSPNGFTTRHPDEEGPVLVDLALFASCLEGRAPLRTQPRMRWSTLEPLRSAFLTAYEDAAGIELDLEALGMLEHATAYAYFRGLHGSGLRTTAAMTVLFNRLKGNRRWWERTR